MAHGVAAAAANGIRGACGKKATSGSGRSASSCNASGVGGDDAIGFGGSCADGISAGSAPKQVSASSQNQAFNALLFLFRNVFEREFGRIDNVVRAKRRPYVPVVLSRQEIDHVIGCMAYPYDLITLLLYGCGLRLFECMKLRVQDVNLDALILTVHDGKGKKDRTVPVPHVLRTALERQIDQVREVHRLDLERGYAGVFLPDALEHKYV